MYTKRNSLVAAGALCVVLATGLFFYLGGVQTPTPPPPGAPQSASVTLTIEGLYENKSVSISLGESALQVLKTINGQDPQLQLSTKEYPGLGVLVVGMHGITNGTDKKYWQYKVNGVMPQVGADLLVLNNGDSVEWFFGTSQE